MLRLRVLGSVDAELDGTAVDLGGPRQRAVLALLSIGRGASSSPERMIDKLWRGEPPAKAAASLQAYVSNLRRLLEPRRQPRETADILVSTSTGYALYLPTDAVDAWRFESALRHARCAEPGEALRVLDEALGWWRGHAYAQFADEEWASDEARRLDELRVQATEAQAEATLKVGRTTTAVALSEVLTREHPVREEGWRLLTLAFWASGRQAEALQTIRRQRDLARGEFGLPAAPALAELEQAILGQRTGVLRASVPVPPQRGKEQLPTAARGSSAPPRMQPSAPTRGNTDPGASTSVFVGRREELRALADAAADARHRGGLVLIAGEAGVGKSTLLARAGEQLAGAGWNVVVGSCPEFDGAPPTSAWVQALRSLAVIAPPARSEALAALLHDQDRLERREDAAAERFLLYQAVGEWIRTAAADTPLVLVLDDLHRADAETLALLEQIAQFQDPALLVLAAYRSEEMEERFTGTLAVLARRAPLRLVLGGLSSSEVAALVTSQNGVPADAATASAITERTGGNPFYVKECAHLLSAEGALAATSQVPLGVRDVLRRRFGHLPANALSMLRLAAVAGADSAVEVLIRASDLPEGDALDGLEVCVANGLLAEPSFDRVRFVHALFRDTVYADLTGVRRCRMHARVAGALLSVDPNDLTGLSLHCSQAAAKALAPQAYEFSVRAADLAERRYAHDAAALFLDRAITALGRIPSESGSQDTKLVELHGRLQEAQIRSGCVAAARETRQSAIDIAERAGRDDLLAAALSGWHVPTPWQTRPYGTVDDSVVRALERLLAKGGLDRAVRCRLLDAVVAELSGADAERVASASREELTLAREIGDPRLLAMALESAMKCRTHELHSEARARLAAELRNLAEADGLPHYLWVCEFVDSCVAAVRNDPDAVRRHAEAGLALASAYRLNEPEAAHLGTLAMLAQIGGNHDEAEARYADAAERMFRHRMLHAVPFAEISRILVAIDRGHYELAEPVARARYARLGPSSGDILALILARQGRREEARAVRREAEPRPDKLFVIHATLRGELVTELGLREQAHDSMQRLLPFADQIAGASTAVHAVGPVAHTLGALNRLLGDENAAAGWFDRAETVARAWGADHWVQASRAGRAALGGPAGRGGTIHSAYILTGDA